MHIYTYIYIYKYIYIYICIYNLKRSSSWSRHKQSDKKIPFPPLPTAIKETQNLPTVTVTKARYGGKKA